LEITVGPFTQDQFGSKLYNFLSNRISEYGNNKKIIIKNIAVVIEVYKMPREKNPMKKEKERLPPGQHLTNSFPVLQKGEIVHQNRSNYILTINGEVENAKKFKLDELMKMIDADLKTDIHCVTTWSKYDTNWRGIFMKTIINIVKPTTKAHFVEFTCADGGFTTTVPIDELNKSNALLALEYENKPIDDNHGGPVRGLLPDLYFYKSAKWVVQIRFLEKDQLGYWENGGYSNKADPWKEERYSYQD
jgi:DMSO/TMAO reductase YedYZ molybdopterin-dependent catalytic subunit